MKPVVTWIGARLLVVALIIVGVYAFAAAPQFVAGLVTGALLVAAAVQFEQRVLR